MKLIDLLFELGYFFVGVVFGGVLWIVIVFLDCLKVYFFVNIKNVDNLVFIVVKSGWLFVVLWNVGGLIIDVMVILWKIGGFCIFFVGE